MKKLIVLMSLSFLAGCDSYDEPNYDRSESTSMNAELTISDQVNERLLTVQGQDGQEMSFDNWIDTLSAEDKLTANEIKRKYVLIAYQFDSVGRQFPTKIENLKQVYQKFTGYESEQAVYNYVLNTFTYTQAVNFFEQKALEFIKSFDDDFMMGTPSEEEQLARTIKASALDQMHSATSALYTFPASYSGSEFHMRSYAINLWSYASLIRKDIRAHILPCSVRGIAKLRKGTTIIRLDELEKKLSHPEDFTQQEISRFKALQVQFKNLRNQWSSLIDSIDNNEAYQAYALDLRTNFKADLEEAFPNRAGQFHLCKDFKFPPR